MKIEEKEERRKDGLKLYRENKMRRPSFRFEKNNDYTSCCCFSFSKRMDSDLFRS